MGKTKKIDNTINKYTAEGMQNEYPVSVCYNDLTKHFSAASWHWHDEAEVIIINSGALKVHTDNVTISLEAGKGIIFMPNVMHELLPIGIKSCTYYSISFHPTFLFGHDQSLLYNKYITPVVNDTDLDTIALDENDSWGENMMNIASEVIAANVAKKYGYELVTKQCLCELWHSILSKVDHSKKAIQTTTVVSPDEERVKAAIRYIEEHYQENVSLEDLSNTLHISKSECCRCFKRNIQMTPFEYLLKYRIYEATKQLLDNPEGSSISDLALSVGFNNSSYFNKVFKKIMQCTPREYKATLKKVEADEGHIFLQKPHVY